MNNKVAGILAVGCVISAFILGMFFVSAKQEQSIRVVGQGVKSLTSDVAKWNVTISKNTGVANQSEGPILIQNEFKKLKKYLIDNGVDVSAKDNGGNNVLMYAVKSGNLDLVKFLVESSSVDINEKNNDNKSAKDIAVEANQVEIAKFLAQKV